MKVLILTYNFPPETGSASAKMFELADYLFKKGHKVTVLTGFPNYPIGIIYDGYKQKLFLKEQGNGFKIIRTWVFTSPKRNKFLPRFLNYTSFMITSVLAGILAGKHDLIYVYLPPIHLGVTAYIVSRIYRMPFILWVNDLWPAAPIALGFLKNSVLIKLAYYIEAFVYRKARKVAVYSLQMKDVLIRKGIPEKKIEIHPLWISTDSYIPKPKDQSILEQYNLKDKFVVMHAGNMGFAQSLEVVIDCARLLEENTKIVFVLIGSGDERDKLIQLKESYGLKNILFIPQQPGEKMAFFFSVADILLVHVKWAEHRYGTIPEKTLAYMSCGKPILIASQEAASYLIRKAMCGLAIEPDNPRAMAEAIDQLMKNDELRKTMGGNARNYVVKYFSREVVLENLEKRLRELKYN